MHKEHIKEVKGLVVILEDTLKKLKNTLNRVEASMTIKADILDVSEDLHHLILDVEDLKPDA